MNGQIVLSKVKPGTFVVAEEKAPDFYRKDPTPQTVVVNAGDTQTLRFYDDPLCTLTILKRDAVTKKPLKGAEFRGQSGGPQQWPVHHRERWDRDGHWSGAQRHHRGV